MPEKNEQKYKCNCPLANTIGYQRQEWDCEWQEMMRAC